MPLLPSDDVGYRIQALRLGVPHVLGIGQVSATSAPFAVETVVVRLVADIDCFIEIGDEPVASATRHFLPQGGSEYFRVAGGERIAAARVGQFDGFLYISEMR